MTRESGEAYKKLPKSEQDGIKDVGGFVGVKHYGWKKKKRCLEYRNLITLDVDFAEGELSLALEGSRVSAVNATVLGGKLLQLASGAVYDEEVLKEL